MGRDFVARLVVSTVIQPDSVLGRVLEWQPLRWIGTLSFSLYLWQELFLPEMRRRWHAEPFSPAAASWNLLAILVCAA